MDQSQSKKTRYVVAGLCGLALLLVIGWLALRKSPPPSPDLPPARAVTVSPRAPLFASNNAAPPETSTNPVAELSAIPTNAATIYRQAFAIFDALSQDQKDSLNNWRTNVDATEAAELCDKIQPICDLMHQAAAVSNCDWGVEQPMTFDTFLPHLNPCRGLARAAVWSAAHCRTNDPTAAVDDLVATSRLGQNLSSSALIGHMVDLAIQGLVIDSVTEHASMLGSAGDTRLMKLLNNVNYDESLRHAYEQEADMVTGLADKLAAMPPEEAMHQMMPTSNGFAASQIQPAGLAQAIKEMRQVAELEKQFSKALELPDAEYRAWMNNLDAIRKTNPYIDALFSPAEGAVIRTQAMTVKSAMAAAGLAVTQTGTDALQSHPDPTTGQPFAYKKTADGFELESSFQVAQKPLSLSFK